MIKFAQTVTCQLEVPNNLIRPFSVLQAKSCPIRGTLNGFSPCMLPSAPKLGFDLKSVTPEDQVQRTVSRLLAAVVSVIRLTQKLVMRCRAPQDALPSSFNLAEVTDHQTAPTDVLHSRKGHLLGPCKLRDNLR